MGVFGLFALFLVGSFLIGLLAISAGFIISFFTHALDFRQALAHARLDSAKGQAESKQAYAEAKSSSILPFKKRSERVPEYVAPAPVEAPHQKAPTSAQIVDWLTAHGVVDSKGNLVVTKGEVDRLSKNASRASAKASKRNTQKSED